MKGYRDGCGVSLLWAALGMQMVLGSAAWAAVEVTVPADFQILAVSAGSMPLCRMGSSSCWCVMRG